jgi:NifU-like protein involved in Fe-S cluster formation
LSDPLYSRDVLKLAAAATGAGELPEPRLSGYATNPVCGDKVLVTMQVDGHGRITEIAHQTRACVFTQAASSILGAQLAGANEARVNTLRHEVEAMLGGAAPPGSPFADFAALAGAAEHKNRHTCVLLPLDAVLGAFAVAEPSEFANPKAEGPKRKLATARDRVRGKKRAPARKAGVRKTGRRRR